MKKITTFLTIFLIGLIIPSCEEKSELTIPEEKMVELLLDAHTLEAVMSETSTNVRDSMNALYYQQFFTIHEISEEEYKSNLDIIQQDPALTNRIYKRVHDSISVRLARAEEKRVETDKEKQ